MTTVLAPYLPVDWRTAPAVNAVHVEPARLAVLDDDHDHDVDWSDADHACDHATTVCLACCADVGCQAVAQLLRLAFGPHRDGPLAPTPSPDGPPALTDVDGRVRVSLRSVELPVDPSTGADEFRFDDVADARDAFPTDHDLADACSPVYVVVGPDGSEHLHSSAAGAYSLAVHLAETTP